MNSGNTGYVITHLENAPIYSLKDVMSEYDLENLKGVDWAVYSYYNGDYDGYGQLICKKDGKFYLISLSHCSCNSPCDDIDWNKESYNTLADLATKNISDYYKEVISSLVKFVKKESLT